MRKLKIGDNLNGMSLFFSFPDVIQDFLNNDYSPSESILFETSTGYSFVAIAYYSGSLLEYHVICMLNGKQYKEIDEVYSINDAGELLTNKQNCILPSDFGVITNVNLNNNFNEYVQIDPEIRIIIDKQPNTNPTADKKTIILKTEPLLAYNNVSDKLEFNSKVNLSIKIIRKLMRDDDGNIVILENQVEEIFDNIDFVLFENDNYIYIEGTNFSDMYMEYLTTSKFNDVYPTRLENASLISQLSDNVLIKVLEKLDGEQIVSLINVCPKAIQILSSKIAMEGYVSINKNFRIDKDGTAYLKNAVIEGGTLKLIEGAKLFTEEGLITNLQFVGTGRKNSQKSVTGEFNELGFVANDGTNLDTNIRSELIFNAEIPSDFTVKSAIIRMIHAPVNYSYEDESGIHYFWGYSRNLKLYKTVDISNFYRKSSLFSSSEETENFSYDEIEGAFGTNGFTANVPTDSLHQVQEIVSIDISSHLISGKLNRIRIASDDNAPVYNGEEWYGNAKICAEKTGICMAVLNIIGYKKFSEGV